MSKTLEIRNLLGEQEGMARYIAYEWDRYNQQRNGWREEQVELRKFLFATDTSTTSVADSTDWKNKTTLPKLTQIRDNLHANYLSSLFPNDSWLLWEGYGLADDTPAKRDAIQMYMENKCREGGFRQVVSRLLLDYIDYGNCFADVEWANEYTVDERGEQTPVFVGPRAVRISPEDLVFNPLAPSFKSSPKILRCVKTLGDLKADAEQMVGEDGDLWRAVIAKAENVRQTLSKFKVDDINKSIGYTVDGFGNMAEYYGSNCVELLTFIGTAYDPSTGEVLKDHVITVLDRHYVVQKKIIPSWLGDTMVHGSWRKRPDNLYGMGPLHNLVGMQYRMDHLENLKADVFDLIAFPPLKIKGDVEDFEWKPRAEIYMDTDGDVQMLVPDVTALQADNQIAQLEARMEEYAGAPRQAMGIRTPGEKTAFEVQTLENAAGRIFQEKITSFEIEVLEPLLQAMLELARRKMDSADMLRVMDNDLGVVQFKEITKADITAKGKLRPVGARHFAQRAQLMQNLTSLFSSPIGQMIAPHASSKKMAQLAEDILGLRRFTLFAPFVSVSEQVEGMQAQAAAQEVLMASTEPTATGPVEPDIPE